MIKLESPCRLDITSEKAYDKFMFNYDKLSKLYNITKEEPLPSAKLRGVYKVVFLDKHLIDKDNSGKLQWLKI